ncbi:hypothetical protein FG381_05070 [Sutterella faecalis]|uniref:DNA polymerase Y family protein n=3 Tax=Sutterella TaxID=40544 RepID=A0AAI9WNT8_9BURK|nr:MULTISPECIES: hypothetical protein [Sutterella]KAB7652865.1 hypothetical protein GBM96_00530 [Sutterella seckii]QDA54369.1 hypothetical protein FG381_05070 [Sutterella faecalis]
MSPDFTLLFFPQLLLALYPKRFSARAAEPAALAVEGRIEARNTCAHAHGIRRGMTEEEALLRLPPLHLERARATAAAELTTLMLLLARRYSKEARLIRSPGSGAAALLLRCGSSDGEKAHACFEALGMKNFSATGSTLMEALDRAVSSAKDELEAFDTEGLVKHARAFGAGVQSLPELKETLALRATLDPDTKPLQAERMAAAIGSWAAAEAFNRLTIEVALRDEAGRPIRRFWEHSRVFIFDEDNPEEETRELAHFLLEAASSTLLGSLSLQVRGEKRIRQTSSLVRKLEERFGSKRVFQLERTGRMLPETLQRHVPAETLRPRAHQRPPVKSEAAGLSFPTEIFSEPREVPLDRGLQPVLEGSLALEPEGRAMNGRTYYRARSTRGERLWLYREDASGRWFLQGRFA